MEKNFQSPDLSIENFSTFQTSSPYDESNAVVVVGLGLAALIRRIGLWKAFRSKIARFRYTAKLALLREIYLWKTVRANSDKLPARCKERRVLWLVDKFPFLSRLALRLEKRLNGKLIANPYQPTLMISKRRSRKVKLSKADLSRANQLQLFAESRQTTRNLSSLLSEEINKQTNKNL